MPNYYGVTQNANRYQARVKAVSLGAYDSPEEAALRVNQHITHNRLDIPLNVIPKVRLAILRGMKRLAVREAVMRTPRNYAAGPEAKIQADIIEMLERKGWFVKHLHGNMYQIGMPDLYACRKGVQRFIEVKNPKSWKFQESQLELFGLLAKQGVGVWVLFGATEEEYAKLFKPANFIFLTDIMK
jgi:hypothetical protein